MKYSYNWLKELSATKKNPQELAQMVTLKGFELEEIEDLGKRFANFVVGKILEIQKHPNADKLQLVTVDVNAKDGQPLDIVCGAWNIKVGDLVPVALVGAIVPLNKITVEAREVRGIKSFGMLCAEDELGLGKDHSGIMILEETAKVGQPLAQVLGLDDHVIDFSILPNRAHDCLCHTGMASEICAMEGRQLKGQRPMVQGAKTGKLLNVEIKEEQLCPRYIGAVLANVKIAPSPKWMQARLAAAGMEPINNVVDITNYVMLELGNPLHAFDQKYVKGNKIIVRKAVGKEFIELLDGNKLELDENDLVIANEEEPMALAGIKGGKNSGIQADTTSIVLEAANFNAYNIRKTRQRHALSTESQARFEKSISPALAAMAAARAIELLEEHAGAKLEEVIDANYSSQDKETVKLELAYVSRLLGYEVPEQEVKKILENLGFVIKNQAAKFLEVEVPLWRLDIEGQEDLIEEVGRIVGYEKIQEQPLLKEVSLPARNKEREFEWKVKVLMADQGFDEMINYSFYSAKDAELFGNVQESLELENPQTSDQQLMRRTLLPGLLANVAFNEKYYNEFFLFELGRVYSLQKEGVKEELKLSGAYYNSNQKSEDNFYELKGKLDAILEKLIAGKIQYLSLEKETSQAFNMARTAAVLAREQALGVFGQASRQALKHFQIKKDVIVFELDFSTLMKLSAGQKMYQKSRIYPEVKRDISLFVDYKTPVDAVRDTIKTAAGTMLLEEDLFDVFLDKENNRKSLALHLSFGAADRTLESGQVDEIFEKIVKELEAKLKAQVRK